jgi:hypothetical protein
MKDGEDIETMFSRFQILVSGLQVLDKSYTEADHVRKVLRSLPPKWRPKVTAFQESKDLDTVSTSVENTFYIWRKAPFTSGESQS